MIDLLYILDMTVCFKTTDMKVIYFYERHKTFWLDRRGFLGYHGCIIPPLVLPLGPADSSSSICT